MNEGYSICLNEWALDKEIKNELGLLLIISGLCAKKGFCYASNEYLAKIFNETTISISRKIKKLEAKNYIKVVYKKRGFEVVAREIRLTKLLTDDYQNCLPSINNFVNGSINQIVKENNTSINNININKRESKEREIAVPSFEEVQVYVKEKNLNVNPKAFYDYFSEGDWKDSKGNKVLNWKQKILTWNKFEKVETSKEDEEAKKEKEKWDRFLRGEI